MAHIPGTKPRIRIFNARSLSIALDGTEKRYPVYHFSGKRFWERPKHNPFAGL